MIPLFIDFFCFYFSFFTLCFLDCFHLDYFTQSGPEPFLNKDVFNSVYNSFSCSNNVKTTSFNSELNHNISNSNPNDINPNNESKFTMKNFYLTSKRRLFWVTWGQFKDKYGSYEDFKRFRDNNISFRNRDEIKEDIKIKKDKIKLHMLTLEWFLRPSKHSRHRNPDQD